jgi:hypothetical protein
VPLVSNCHRRAMVWFTWGGATHCSGKIWNWSMETALDFFPAKSGCRDLAVFFRSFLDWSGLILKFFGVYLGCPCHVNVTVLMEHHPILISRL